VALPHRFPFLFVDRRRADRAIVALTLGGTWQRAGGAMPLSLLVEAMAQAAAVILEDPRGERRELVLAGLEAVELSAPARPGDRLEIEVRLEARLGGVVRVAAIASREGATVARGALFLAAP
jgi:3-hydroxymyristoyl/3-hydroxydecanoyl-(acyl carrier protein) dehydratase